MPGVFTVLLSNKPHTHTHPHPPSAHFLLLLLQIRTLRLKILSEAVAEGVLVRGAKNQLRMYLTMAVAGMQPLFMYWLTFHLIH